MSFYKRKIITFGVALCLTVSPLVAADYDNHWAKEAISKWEAYGIVKGYEDDTFRPNNTLTRAEFATILGRVLNLPETNSVTSFMDIMINADRWYASSVNKVTSLGLMYVEGINFMPNQAITREEAAYALAKAYELSAEKEQVGQFTDEAQMSDWAVKSIQALTERGYLKGNPDGSFKPQGTLTRAELVTMLNNITQHVISQPGIYSQSITGNVLVNAKGVTFKNMTINGNLYLTQGIGSEAVTLENVTVKGKLYINSGTVIMSGSFSEVYLASGLPLRLAQGNIEKLVVNQLGSTLTVDEKAAVKEIVENKYLDLAGEGMIEGKPIIQTGTNMGGAGGGGGANSGIEQSLEITTAGIYINDEYISLPVSENVITLDIPTLSQQFSLEDEVNGLIIETNSPGAELVSRFGSMESGKKYTFRNTEDELGIIREAALRVGVSPTAAINYVFGVDKLTIGSLLESFEAAKQNAVQMDIELQDEYEFTREIKPISGTSGQFTIKMNIQ